MSYRHRVSRQMSSGRGVSGYLPSECSACLTDTECQGRCSPDEECQGICLLDAVRVSRRRMSRQMSSRQGLSGHLPSEHSPCLPDAECQGKCRPDDTCHGIRLPDEECQGICLLKAARELQTQSVKADVIGMRSIRAFAFWTDVTP